MTVSRPRRGMSEYRVQGRPAGGHQEQGQQNRVSHGPEGDSTHVDFLLQTRHLRLTCSPS